MGLGLSGAYGAAALRNELLRTLAQRRADAQAQQAAEQQAIENAIKERTLSQQGSQFDARLGLDQSRLGLDQSKFGEDVRQFDAGAPAREAGVLHTTAQTADLNREPAEAETQRGFLRSQAAQAQANELAQIAAQGAQARQTKQTADPGDAKAGDTGPTAYGIANARRTIQAVNDVLPKIGPTTSGFVGKALKGFGGTSAANVSADLSSVASNVAFQALMDMRQSSKTGGALGQVSERELDLLTSVEGSIRQDQSPENLRRNLVKIKESQERWLAEAIRLEGGGAAGGMVNMKAPNGQMKEVSPDQVDFYKSRGAVVVP